MSQTATDLLNDLAQKDLVPGEIVASLRAQVAKAVKPVPPQTITKLLVEKGHLTAAQAQKLLGSGASSTAIGVAKSAVATAGKSSIATAAKPTVKSAAQQAASATRPIANDLTPLEGLQELDELESLDGLEALESPATAQADDLAPLDSLGDGDLFGAPVAADPLQSPAASGTRLAAGGLKPAQSQQPIAAQPRSLATTLLLVANGVALVLLLGSIALAMFPRASGDAEFQQAEGEYTAKNFVGAIEQYDVLLAKYPQHSQAGLARVHRGLARLRVAGGSPAALLPVAKSVLAEIGSEPQLTEAHSELAPLVCDLACGLAEQAAAEKSPEQLIAAREALTLANDGRFVPGNLRPWQRLQSNEESLAVTEREIAKSGIQQKQLATARQAIGAKKLAAAYEARAELLALYPDLTRDPALKDLGKELSAAALAAVAEADIAGQPETTEGPSPTVRLPAAATPGQTFFAVAGGKLWALDAAKGNLLWHRPVGGGAAPPVQVAPGADSDIVLIDAAASEVVRLAARTGALKWRRGIAAPLVLPPLVSGQQVVVAARDGRVIALDAQTGQTKAAIQLPTVIRVAPATAGGQILVAADRHDLFSLAANDLVAQSAIPLGHEAGSVAVPPIALPAHVAIAENRGASSAVLLVVGESGAVVQELPVAGCVVTPPVLVGSRLVVPTERGGAFVFDVTSDGKVPLKPAGELPPADVASYAGERSGKLLLAGLGLQQSELAARGKGVVIEPLWAAFSGSVCLAPPQVSGETICCVRRTPSSPVAFAAAVRAANGQPLWETRLSLPEAAP